MKWAAAIALTAGLLANLTPSASAASAMAAKEVRNTGAYSIGAIQVADGNYAQGNGKYDALIPPGRYSGWASTAGIYIGPNYCVRIRQWLNSSGSQLGSLQIAYGESYALFPSGPPGWDIKALPVSDNGCWNAAATVKDGQILSRS